MNQRTARAVWNVSSAVDAGLMMRSELADHYQRSLQSISPLQWCDWFQLDFENVFTQVQLVRGDRRRVLAHGAQHAK